MEKVTLSAKTRDVLGRKTNKGRKEGLIPSVVYGRGIASVNLWVNALDFLRLVKKYGESTMFSLEIDEKNNRNVIIYEIQNDPMSGNPIHLDFFQVRMDEEIEKEVELNYIGESEAVATLGGVLVKSIAEITVKCLPADLPSHIDVDISVIKTFDDHICISDLKISDKVSVEIDPETVVALVNPPRSESELEGLEEKVEADVTKVEGVVKDNPPAGGAPKEEEKKEKK
jgi:large subunit ribosomal protein L25